MDSSAKELDRILEINNKNNLKIMVRQKSQYVSFNQIDIIDYIFQNTVTSKSIVLLLLIGCLKGLVTSLNN